MAISNYRNKLGNLGRQTGTENRNRAKLNIHVTPVVLQINVQGTNILCSLSINMRSCVACRIIIDKFENVVENSFR